MKGFMIVIMCLLIFGSSMAYSECEECEEKRKKVAEELKETNVKVEVLNEQLNKKNKELRILKNQKIDFEKKYNECLAQSNGSNENVKKNDSLSTIIKYLEEELSKIEIKYDELEADRNIKEATITRMQKDSSDFAQQISLKTDSIKSYLKYISELEGIPVDERLRIKVAKLKQEIKNLEKSKENLTKSRDSLNEAFTDLSDDVSKMETQRKKLESEITKFKAEKETLEKDIKRSEEKLKELNRLVKNEKDNFDDVKDEISKLENKISNLEQYIDRLEGTIAGLKRQLPYLFTIGVSLSANWSYGMIENKQTVFSINSQHFRSFFGVNLTSNQNSNGSRNRATAIAIFMNTGFQKRYNTMRELIDQDILVYDNFNENHLNRFAEYEAGLILDEILQLSAGVGRLDYQIFESNQKMDQSFRYYTFTLGLQAPISINFDFGLSSTFKFGQDVKRTSARFGAYATYKFNFFRKT